MRYLTGMPVEVEYAKADLLNIYRGAIAEQFVGQEMVLSQKGDICYWSRREKSSSAEVDYLAVINGRIHPIEVKSEPSGKLKSLHLFLKKHIKNHQKILFFPCKIMPNYRKKNITFIPLYFTFSGTGGKASCL